MRGCERRLTEHGRNTKKEESCGGSHLQSTATRLGQRTPQGGRLVSGAIRLLLLALRLSFLHPDISWDSAETNART